MASTGIGRWVFWTLLAVVSVPAVAGTTEIWSVAHDDAWEDPALVTGEQGRVWAAVPSSPQNGPTRLQLLRIEPDGQISKPFEVEDPGLSGRASLIRLPGGDLVAATISTAGLVVRRIDATGSIVFSTPVPGATQTLSQFFGIRPGLATDGTGAVYVTVEASGDFLTAKIDSQGGVVWTRTFDPSNGGEDAPSAIVYGHQRITVAGMSNDGVAIVQYDTQGVEKWNEVEPNHAPILPLGPSYLAVGPDGQVALAGTPESDCGKLEVLLRLYHLDGTPLWTRNFPAAFCDSGSPAAVEIDTDGDVVVVASAVDDHDGFLRIHVYRYDAQGNLEWQDDHDATGLVDLAGAAALDRFGRVHVVGTTTLASQSRDFVTVTWSSTGEPRLTAEWSGPGAQNDFGTDLVVDDAGAVTSAGLAAGVGAAFVRYQVATSDCNANSVLDDEESVCVGDCDADADGCLDDLDCAPGDAAVWSAPGEITPLELRRTGATARLEWRPPSFPGGGSVVYDVLRTPDGSDFGTSVCFATGIAGTFADDPAVPAEGEPQFYLVRARNDCPGVVGSVGSGSDGRPRTAPLCE